MKTQHLQAKRQSFAIKLITALIISLLAVSMIPLSICGEDVEKSIITENYNLTEEYSAKLGQEIAEYELLDTSPTDSVSKSVAALVNLYRKELLDLQGHPDASTRPLSGECRLAYEKGVAAGKIGWIYHYNLSYLSATESEKAVTAIFDSLCKEVGSSTDPAVLSARSTAMCNELNKAIYAERIRLLASPNDSVYSASIIAGAVDSLGQISSPDLFGAAYAARLTETVKKLELQRCRDSLTLQMQDIRRIAEAESSTEAEELAALLNYKLQNASDLSTMNEAMRSTLCKLIGKTGESTSAGYVLTLIAQLCADIDEIASGASAAGEAGSFTPIFTDYPERMRKALLKDSIAELLLGGAEENTLNQALEQKFNKDGGLADACTSATQQEALLSKAEAVRLLCDTSVDTQEKLAVIMGQYDSSSLLDSLESIRASATEKLISLTTTNTLKNDILAIVNSAKADMSSLLDEAKAQRFLADHKAIIKKPVSELTVGDELPLRAAITSYISLSDSVRTILGSQINFIVEKYKSVLCTKISSFKENDAFYSELSQALTKALQELSADNIVDFYNECDIILKKSSTLSELITGYREFTSAQLYESYTKDEKDALAGICTSASKQISVLSSTSEKEIDTQLRVVLNNAILALTRADLYTRARVASSGCTTADMQKIFSTLKADLAACADVSEMQRLTDLAIFKIQRILTVEAIISHSDTLEYKINEMPFLNADEKIIFAGRIKGIKSAYVSSGASAESITVLSFAWSAFSEALGEVSEEANGIDLHRAIDSYLSSAESTLSKAENEIRALAHLEKERIDRLLDSCASTLASFKTELAICTSSADVAKLYSTFEDQLAKIKQSAVSENLSVYRLIIAERMDEFKSIKQNYSDENYNKILSAISRTKGALAQCGTTVACDNLLSSLKNEVEAINDLLDDALADALLALEEARDKCVSSKSQYSEQSLEQIEKIYSDACLHLREYTEISSIAQLNRDLSDALLLIKQVRKDKIYSSDKAELIGQSGLRYPDSYSTDKGYWAYIYSPEGLISDALLSVRPFEEKSTSSIQATVRRAARGGNITSTAKLTSSQLGLLKKCVISQALDITLSESDSKISRYTLRMLLPSSYAEENVLGLIFVDKNNKVEFYSAERDGHLISVNLSHLSKFYIVMENTTNLVPLIIFLIILLIFEFVILAFVLLLRHNRKRKENGMIPEGYLNSLIPLTPFALRIKPEGGVTLALLLSVAALALGCGIAIMARTELKALKKAARPGESDLPSEDDREQKRLAQASRLRLEGPKTEAAPAVEEPVLCTVAAREEEGDIQAFVYTSEPIIEPEEESDDPSFALHRAEINLDVIAQRFDDGELVNLDALKKKRLVSKRTDYVKILARGSLTKPLIIEAHDFSHAAEEMLRAVGGEAIRIK